MAMSPTVIVRGVACLITWPMLKSSKKLPALVFDMILTAILGPERWSWCIRRAFIYVAAVAAQEREATSRREFATDCARAKGGPESVHVDRIHPRSGADARRADAAGHPSGLGAHHPLGERASHTRFDRLGLADLQRLAAVSVRLSHRNHARRLARGGAALALRGHVVAGGERPHLRAAGHRDRPLPAQTASDPPGRGPSRCQSGDNRNARPRESRHLQRRSEAALPRHHSRRLPHRAVGPRHLETGAIAAADRAVRRL